MVRDIKNGNISAVYVLDVSSITKDIVKLEELVDIFEKHNVPLIAVNNRINTSSNKEIQFLKLIIGILPFLL